MQALSRGTRDHRSITSQEIPYESGLLIGPGKWDGEFTLTAAEALLLPVRITPKICGSSAAFYLLKNIGCIKKLMRPPLPDKPGIPLSFDTLLIYQ